MACFRQSSSVMSSMQHRRLSALAPFGSGTTKCSTRFVACCSAKESGILIDEADGMPSSSAYRTRFGSLLRAYSLVGYTPRRDYRYIDINQALRKLHPEIIADVLGGLHGVG